MHGQINLVSELGRGTTTTFWIPFSKPQSTKRGSPLEGVGLVPERSGLLVSIPGCYSAPQSVVGDLQDMAPPLHLDSRTSTGSGLVSPGEEKTEDLVEKELDRKDVHVLIVEDKYVVIPIRMCSF